MRGRVLDVDGSPLAGALVDAWQSSPVGLYDNQDPEQADMNLRGRFRTDAEGRFWFRSVRPAGYPVPTDGPVGHLLREQHRHPYRPAHVHFIVSAPGHRTLITQIFVDDDEYLATDVVFGVKQSIVGGFERHERPDEVRYPERRGAVLHARLRFPAARGRADLPDRADRLSISRGGKAMSTNPLAGKVAVVCGGSGGIGAGSARLLAAAGATVVVGYHSNAAKAASVAAGLSGEGHLALAAPMTDSDALGRLAVPSPPDSAGPTSWSTRPA